MKDLVGRLGGCPSLQCVPYVAFRSPSHLQVARRHAGQHVLRPPAANEGIRRRTNTCCFHRYYILIAMASSLLCDDLHQIASLLLAIVFFSQLLGRLRSFCFSCLSKLDVQDEVTNTKAWHARDNSSQIMGTRRTRAVSPAVVCACNIMLPMVHNAPLLNQIDRYRQIM